jgi:hypothetical protein
MQVLRRAAVLVLLGLSLGISGANAIPIRPHESREVTRSVDRIEPWWDLVTGVLNKAGCSINPLGLCGVIPATQAPAADAGCRIDPLGQCLTGH